MGRARADDAPSLDAPLRFDRRALGPAAGAPPGGGWVRLAEWGRAFPNPTETPWARADDALPRFRLEAALRLGNVPLVKLRHGPGDRSNTVHLHGDTHLPRGLALGWRVVAEVKPLAWLAVGAHYARLQVDGPRRNVHYTGLALDGVRFPPGARARTSIDLQVGEVYARYVVRDDEAIRFAIGPGAAWGSQRIGVFAGDRHAVVRAETFYVPTLSYLLQVRLAPICSAWVESLTGVFAPWRFPSLLTETRVGLRWDLVAGLELTTGASLSMGSVEDTEDLWGGRRRPGERVRRANWLAVAGEVGLAVRF